MMILRHKRRGSMAIEAVLVLPIMLVIFGAVAQVMIIAQGRIYLEQAAYAAARSALVHMCRPSDILCTPKAQKWEDAARWALLPAASTKTGGTCPSIPAGEQALTADNRIAGRTTAAINALCYAFADGNVEVTANWVFGTSTTAIGPDYLPVRVTVRFRQPLSTPFQKFVRDGETNGISWKWGQATVTLL